jgi:probable addiction module antidote protein
MKSKLFRDYQEDLIQSLKNPREAQAYLDAALDEKDQKYFLKALRNVAEANGGIGKVAAGTKLNRESLYKMLSENGNPKMETVEEVLGFLGFRLSVQPRGKKLVEAHR